MLSEVFAWIAVPFTRVTQVVGDYASLMLRLMGLGLGQPRVFNPINDFVFLPYRYVLLVSPAPF